MTSKPSAETASRAGGKSAKNTREERLAAALRANLKRRKQQARVRDAAKDTQEAGN
jgi:hypothetical protein